MVDQCEGGRGGGAINITPGLLSLGPLAFMVSQENKSPQETERGPHTRVHVFVEDNEECVYNAATVHFVTFTCAHR